MTSTVIFLHSTNSQMNSMNGTMGRLSEITIGKSIRFISENGEFFNTSSIVSTNMQKRLLQVKTKNSTYVFAIVK